MLSDFRNLFEHKEEENYNNSVRENNFWSNSYIEYESNSNKNKILSVEEHLNIIRPYLKNIINNLKNLTHGKFIKKILIVVDHISILLIG